MKCPLISIGYLASERVDATKKCECGKEECAWFHPTTQSCEISRIASNLSSLNSYLEDIRDKMPHSRQFLK